MFSWISCTATFADVTHQHLQLGVGREYVTVLDPTHANTSVFLLLVIKECCCCPFAKAPIWRKRPRAKTGPHETVWLPRISTLQRLLASRSYKVVTDFISRKPFCTSFPYFIRVSSVLNTIICGGKYSSTCILQLVCFSLLSPSYASL